MTTTLGSTTTTTVEPKLTKTLDKKPIEKKINYNIDEMFIDAHDYKDINVLVTMLWGGADSGKTYVALKWPGKIIYLDTDGGIKANTKYIPKDKIVQIIELVTFSNDETKSLQENQDLSPLLSLEKTEYVIHKLHSLNLQPNDTIVIDTITDLWSWIGAWIKATTEMSISKTGSEYMSRLAWGAANVKYKFLIDELKSIGCNIVLIATVKELYDAKGKPLGITSFDGQKKADHHVDLVIEMSRMLDGKTGKYTGDYKSTITKSRGYKLVNSVIINMTHEKLLTCLKNVHPNTD